MAGISPSLIYHKLLTRPPITMPNGWPTVRWRLIQGGEHSHEHQIRPVGKPSCFQYLKVLRRPGPRDSQIDDLNALPFDPTLEGFL